MGDVSKTVHLGLEGLSKAGTEGESKGSPDGSYTKATVSARPPKPVRVKSGYKSKPAKKPDSKVRRGAVGPGPSRPGGKRP